MNVLWEAFVEPVVRYPFMRDGLIVAVIVGVTCAVLSCLLVVRRQSLLGDAIAHSVLLGVAVGWLAAGTVGVFWGALAAGVLAGVLIAVIERTSRVKLDAAMGVVFSAAFALGLVIIGRARPAGVDLFHVLFGNVIGVSRADVWLTAVSGALVMVVVVALFRDFHLWSFDPDQARVLGVPTGGLHYVFTALLSAAIVASLQAVGVVLVVAMLVIPGATAYLLAERLATMMRVAAVCGVLAAVGGLYGSFHADVASGPAIVLVASAVFVLAFFFAPRRGVAIRALHRRRAASRVAEEDLLKRLVKAEREHEEPVAASELGEEAGRVAARLRRRGLARRSGDRLRLTDEGALEGVRLVSTHRLLESYLHDAEGFALHELHAAADRLEHDLRPGDVDDIAANLGRPAADPHGHPIPYETDDLGTIAGRPLWEADAGSGGRVVMVADDRDDLLRRMVALGVIPDAAIDVLGRDAGLLRVRIDGREARVPEEIATRVYVVGDVRRS
jgi:manganese transport system permease protein